MRRLLNTIYITNENMYLTLDGENLVCKLDGEVNAVCRLTILRGLSHELHRLLAGIDGENA